MKRNSLLSIWLFIFGFIPFFLPAQGILIQRGACVTVENGAKVHVDDGSSLSKVIIKSDDLGSGSLVDYTTNTTGGVTVDGNFNIELYLTACDNSAGKCWHYVSVPVTSTTASVFNGDFLKSFDEVTGLWSGYYTHGYTPLNVMQGYAVARPVGNADTKTFTGTVNSEVALHPLTRHNGNDPLNPWNGTGGWGYNLVGNPYPSAVNIMSSSITWNNLDEKVWYYNKAGKNYLVYAKDPPVGGNTGSQYIPAMQGFYIHVTEGQTSGSLTIPNAARYHDISVPYYKSGEFDNGPNVLFLKAEDNQSSGYDLASIVFWDGSKPEYENQFDCTKMYGDNSSPQIYTVTDDNSKVTKNVLPFAGINTTIPLNFEVINGKSDTYSITAIGLDNFRAGTKIYLKDLKINFTQELSLTPVYQFTYSPGDDPARFLLTFDNPFFSIPENGKTNGIDIYSSGDYLFIKNNSGIALKGDLYLYDMLGRLMFSKKLENKLLNKFDPENAETGYYLVRIVTSEETYVRKVFLD
jgi:hypothetical protein